jgi:D-psicose/D-tagatose/L-ribulose 3-epimerase
MISISNIAWENIYDLLVVNLLKKFNIENIEIAITKINGTWDISTNELDSFLMFYKKQNINIYSAQSINFKNDSNLFYDNNDFLKHIFKVIEICGYLGVRKVIFGSPKNRYKKLDDKNLNFDEIFINTMIKISEKCNIYDIVFCIEPNSTKYNCNYIINSEECLSLINLIKKDNIKIHLDSACMHMENDYVKNNTVFENLEHYHISCPFLGKIYEDNNVNHSLYSEMLNKNKYDKIKTIEMLYSGDDYLRSIEQSILFSQEKYR